PTLANARMTRSRASVLTPSPVIVSCAAVSGPLTWSVSGMFSLEISEIARATHPPIAICITTACGGSACGTELGALISCTLANNFRNSVSLPKHNLLYHGPSPPRSSKAYPRFSGFSNDRLLRLRDGVQQDDPPSLPGISISAGAGSSP